MFLQLHIKIIFYCSRFYGLIMYKLRSSDEELTFIIAIEWRWKECRLIKPQMRIDHHLLMLRVIQKYDGMWSSREEISTCEKRKERASPLNGTMRLDWTIDPERCNCNMQLGEYVAPDPNRVGMDGFYRYASQPVYNPWCGQPTMQDQIFGPMDSALIYLTHGIFGPTGLGEIFQYYSDNSYGFNWNRNFKFSNGLHS